jgi:hypothetical protein
MIRSARIPGILSRITSDNVIQTALLVTGEGELLGATSPTFVSPEGTKESVECLGTLIADIAVDYRRLGDEYAQLEPSATSKKSHLKCLLLELDHGLVAVSACAEVNYLVIGIAAPNAPMGMVKARLEAITEHVQEALAPLTETLYR